jgi:Fur family ferric uptake transcriptional regulator
VAGVRPGARARVRRKLEAYRIARGLRGSPLRDAVVEVLITAGHADFVEILAGVRRTRPGVSASSIYEVLRFLEDADVARKIDSGDASRWEIPPADDYLVCVRCGKLVEFEDKTIEDARREVAARLGFTMTSHRQELSGYCGECRPR